MSYSQHTNRRPQPSGNSISLFPFLAVLLCTMGALISVLLIMARQAQLSTDEMAAEMLEDSEEKALAGDSPVTVPEKIPEDLFALDVPKEEDAKELNPESESGAELASDSDSSSDSDSDFASDTGTDFLSEELPELSLEEIQKRTEELVQQRRQEEWRLGELTEVQAEAEKQAQDARIALASMQENRNRLLQQVGVFLEALGKMKNAPEEQTFQQLKDEIAARKLQIEKLKRDVEKAENAAENQNGSYAILPHDGPNGTRRYPIYIECREDGAWLMPENIKLSMGDFEGTLSMENPLESALLAKRQYLLRSGVFQETPLREQEPYPLIIVRPEGILYMYMVRGALQSWKSEYGYELVDDSMKIAYPPRDENLKMAVNDAIQAARARQQQIAAMAPTLSQGSGGSGGVVYHPNSQGVTAVPLDPNSRLARSFERPSAQSAPYNGSYGSNGAFPAAGASPGALSGTSPGVSPGTSSNVSPGVSPETVSGTVPGTASRAGNGVFSGTENTNESDGSAASGNPENRGSNSVAESAQNFSLWNTVTPGEEENGETSGSSASGNRFSSASGGVSGNASGSVSDGGSGRGSGSSPTGVSGGPDGAPQSIASKEGQNWALDDYRPSLTSLTRPIPVECRTDRYVLSAVPGFDPVEIPISAPISTVKRLAHEIKTQIRQWGEAGRGAYWKPILRVRVAPEARAQFEMLKNLLEGSGLEVEEVL